MISLVKTIVVFTALSFASYQDLRTREIDDRVWLVTIPVGAVLTALEILTTPGYPLLLLVFSLGLSVALALGIGYIGLYGGADAKALIAIAVTLPLPPYFHIDPSPFYALTVFGNAVILSLVLIPACAIWNSVWWIKRKRKRKRERERGGLFEGLKATGLQKTAAFFTGVKVKSETAKSVHLNLLEKTSENGVHYIKLFTRVTEDEEPKVIDKESKYVWATPAIPMIVFFLFGFLLSFAAGDIILRIVQFFMGAMA